MYEVQDMVDEQAKKIKRKKNDEKGRGRKGKNDIQKQTEIDEVRRKQRNRKRRQTNNRRNRERLKGTGQVERRERME